MAESLRIERPSSLILTALIIAGLVSAVPCLVDFEDALLDSVDTWAAGIRAVETELFPDMVDPKP
jgi:hypothetical protein